MANVYGPILPLQLDPRNLVQIVRAIQTRINIESNGTLNDFTPASPLAAISEGQAFAQSELLYYLNNLPEAFSLQWFRQLGVQRIIGSRSTATVTFFPVPGYQGSIIIPAGTKLYSDSGLTFILVDEVILGTGDVNATGIVRSERWGSLYNVGPNEINKIERSFLGLGSLTNVDPASGGRDIESVDQMKTRVFELMSRRNLTTVNDFENELKMIAPEAQIVKALTYEERFSILPQDVGGVFIVAGDENGNPIPESSRKLVIDSLKNRVVMGTSVSIIPPDVIPLDVSIEIYYNPANLTTSLELEAQNVYTTLAQALNPQALGIGSDLKYQDFLKLVYADSQIADSINNFNIKVMIPSDAILDGPCAGFSGEESIDETECLYDYSYVVDSSTSVYTSPSSITSFKMWRCIVSLTSNTSYNSNTFIYSDIYTLPQES